MKRFMPVVAILVLLLAGDAAADVVVFADGTRMSVRGYQVKGNVVVITTEDGKLRSVPSKYINLEATERLNGRPPTGSPTPSSPEPAAPPAAPAPPTPPAPPAAHECCACRPHSGLFPGLRQFRVCQRLGAGRAASGLDKRRAGSESGDSFAGLAGARHGLLARRSRSAGKAGRPSTRHLGTHSSTHARLSGFPGSRSGDRNLGVGGLDVPFARIGTSQPRSVHRPRVTVRQASRRPPSLQPYRRLLLRGLGLRAEPAPS